MKSSETLGSDNRRELKRYEEILDHGFLDTPIRCAVRDMLTLSVISPMDNERTPRIRRTTIFIFCGGMDVEQTTEMMKAANEQLSEARKQLEDTANQIRHLREIVFPQLAEYTLEIRSVRMTAVTEMGAILNEMRQVHKFFIDASYDREMKELERFVGLCKEIQKLKADGVFDAICDSAIRLSLKEPVR